MPKPYLKEISLNRDLLFEDIQEGILEFKIEEAETESVSDNSSELEEVGAEPSGGKHWFDDTGEWDDEEDTAVSSIEEVEEEKIEVDPFEHYPFSIPVVKNLETLEFHPDVTFLVGENGSGKSTLIEAIAIALEFNAEGGTANANFTTDETHSKLHKYLRLNRGLDRPKDSYFLRAESFYSLASYIEEVGYLKGYGGESLHELSHGEAFFAILNNKFRGRGIYILDEPEAAWSPSRQIAALAALHRLVRKDSQFIIATHSPILLAYPHAKILHLSDKGMQEINYKDTEHYQVAKDFLNNPEQMLGHLLD